MKEAYARYVQKLGACGGGVANFRRFDDPRAFWEETCIEEHLIWYVVAVGVSGKRLVRACLTWLKSDSLAEYPLDLVPEPTLERLQQIGRWCESSNPLPEFPCHGIDSYTMLGRVNEPYRDWSIRYAVHHLTRTVQSYCEPVFVSARIEPAATFWHAVCQHIIPFVFARKPGPMLATRLRAEFSGEEIQRAADEALERGGT